MTRTLHTAALLATLALMALATTGCGDLTSATGEFGRVNYQLHTDYLMEEALLTQVGIITGHQQHIGTTLTDAGENEAGNDGEEITHEVTPSEGVTIEAEYAVGEYDIVILSAERSSGLERWLRKNRYKIPRGGPYRLVSCPNYLGEMVEWGGWALLTWSMPGLAFAAWTAANLLPRAMTHHRWYQDKFPDYPRERRAVIPFLL